MDIMQIVTDGGAFSWALMIVAAIAGTGSVSVSLGLLLQKVPPTMGVVPTSLILLVGTAAGVHGLRIGGESTQQLGEAIDLVLAIHLLIGPIVGLVALLTLGLCAAGGVMASSKRYGPSVAIAILTLVVIGATCGHAAVMGDAWGAARSVVYLIGGALVAIAALGDDEKRGALNGAVAAGTLPLVVGAVETAYVAWTQHKAWAGELDMAETLNLLSVSSPLQWIALLGALGVSMVGVTASGRDATWAPMSWSVVGTAAAVPACWWANATFLLVMAGTP